jgi:amino-acid N-acetyltransferase
MTMSTTTLTSIRAATPQDAPAVRSLLADSELPLDGVPEDLEHFLVAEREGTVVGAIGMEFYGSAGLLRSAVVSPTVRGSGIGDRLVIALLADARSKGTTDVVLLTTTADTWFPRFGFTRTTRAEVPASLHASEEFRGACPDSAVVMRLSM